MNITKTAREKTKLSQSKFAELTKIPLSTIQDWEQKNRTPSASTQALFNLIINHTSEMMFLLRH